MQSLSRETGTIELFTTASVHDGGLSINLPFSNLNRGSPGCFSSVFMWEHDSRHRPVPFDYYVDLRTIGVPVHAEGNPSIPLYVRLRYPRLSSPCPHHTGHPNHLRDGVLWIPPGNRRTGGPHLLSSILLITTILPGLNRSIQATSFRRKLIADDNLPMALLVVTGSEDPHRHLRPVHGHEIQGTQALQQG